MIIPFILNALAYSIYSPIIWSIIKYEVDQDLIGTAYGIVFASYNLIGLIPLIIYAVLVDSYNTKEYKNTRTGFLAA